IHNSSVTFVLSLSDLTHVVSVSPPHLVVVRSGENVTLQCINVLKKVGHVGWFKQVNSSEPLCITSMWSSLPTVHHQNGFQGNHMKMLITNRSTLLRITEVDVADSGLYFCGMLDNYFIFTNATVLKVQVDFLTHLIVPEVTKIMTRTLQSTMKKVCSFLPQNRNKVQQHLIST
uniref:Ig-like domain-containing protein n=1 Tax=Hucho hucho TaxID=62062 RepID=A0A4W5JE37_9TELE